MQKPQESFNIREAKGEDFYKIMVVNESLKHFNNYNSYPWILFIEIDIKEKTKPYNLPTNEEAEVLNLLEDKLTDLISSSIPYQYVGRITDNGKRELYYYLENPKIVHEKLNNLIEGGNYEREFEYSISKDPNWDKVAFFFNY